MAREPRAGGTVSSSTGHLIPRARRPADEGAVESVLDTKVSPPVPSTPVLPRPRLYEALAVATEHRVTVVNASAGAGKTLLLASWLRWSTRRRSAWVSFDPGDNEPKVFWSYVVEALRRACSTRETALFGRLAGNDLGGDRFPERLLEAVADLDEPVVLVIDQAHEITDWRLLAGLEVVLRHAPATLRIVLSGRGLPAIPLARLRVAGDLADIGSGDLACTPAEAMDLFALYGMRLDPDQIDGLLARTEGWIAGLRLAVLWWQAQPEGRRDASGFTGEQSLVADYLSDEVVGARSSRIRRFLLRTCVVERVTAELADELTGENDGRQTLDALERENALVRAVGPQRIWYGYGPLLREYLTHQLRREMPDELPDLHRQAAQWFARHGFVVEAERNAVRAGDWDLAGRLLVSGGWRAFANGEGAELAPLLAEIPADQVSANPDLAAVCAHARLSAADADGAEAFLRLVEESSPLPRRLKAAELRLHQACLRGRVEPETATRAYALLDEARAAGLATASQHELGTLAYWLGVAELWSDRPGAARRAFEQALPRLVDGGFGDWERRSRGWLALLNAGEGRLAAAERFLAAAPGSTPVADRAPASSNGNAGGTGRGAHPVQGIHSTAYLLARVVADLERDRLDQAWNVLASLDTTPASAGTDGGYPADSPAYPPLDELVGLLRARVLIHQGDLTAAKAELASAKAAARRLRAQVDRKAALLDVEIQLHEGNIARAREVLDTFDGAPVPDRNAVTVVRGRTQLADGDPTGALDTVAPFLSDSPQARLVDTVAALLVAATAHRRLGTQDSATAHLERALGLAQDDGLIRVFLDAGRGVRALLTVVIAPEGPHAGFRSSLLHRFDVQPTASWKSPEKAVRLTASERAVLRYLPSHLTNEEIAQDLCLSVNTVKSHLRTLYRKLGVTCRREAIARALQLELLR